VGIVYDGKQYLCQKVTGWRVMGNMWFVVMLVVFYGYLGKYHALLSYKRQDIKTEV
jgi:hypothetical protein